MRRQVVISGIGTVSALGVGLPALWEGLRAGTSAIALPTRLNPAGLSCQLAAEIKDFSAKDFVPKSYRKAVKVMARDIEVAVACAKLAAADAKLVTRAAEDGATPTAPTTPTIAPERVGCQIGAGLIAAETLELTSALASAVVDGAPSGERVRGGFDYRAWGTVATQQWSQVGGMENLQPLWMLKYLPNMLACHVTIIHGCEGPSNTHTNAECSGLLSIGEGARVIERGAADASFSGSAESKVNLTSVARTVLSKRVAQVDAGQASTFRVRPYETDSCVPGEGGGLVILEEAGSAASRGVKPYALVAGFGAAHSLERLRPPFVAPARTTANDGLARAIAAALRDAQLDASAIDAVVPQASGCAAFDLPEAQTLRNVLGARAGSVPLVTLTPSLGDCFAGTGGLQVAVAAMMLREQQVPRNCLTLTQGGVAPCPAGPRQLRTVLVCSSSMGGQNAAVVLRGIA